MKKKTKYIILIAIVTVIIVYVGLVLILSSLVDKKHVLDKFRSTSWNWVRDEFNSTKIVEYKGQIIPNTSITFYDKTVMFCNYDENNENFNNDYVDNYCKEYEFSFDKTTITVFADDKSKVIYSYQFNDNNELVLTYNGDGFQLVDYYSIVSG